MLKKSNRLVKRSDFIELRNKGEMIQNPIFGLMRLSGGNDGIKIGMIISKRISKKAVERNRLKRWIALGVRKNWNLIDNDTKLLFLVKKNILKKSQMEVNWEIERVLEKARVA